MQDKSDIARGKDWDTRLNVNSYIPEYNPIIDKHTKSYKRVVQQMQ